MGTLVEFDWDPDTGLATIKYEKPTGERSPDRRSNERSCNGVEVLTVIRPQPTNRSHVGWSADPHVRNFVDHDMPFPVRDTAV